MTVPWKTPATLRLLREERVGITQVNGFVAGAGGILTGFVNVGRHLISKHLGANGQSLRKIVL